MEIYNVILRTVLVYFLIAFIVRFLGKREVGQLQVFDLIVLLVIADVGALGIENKSIPFWHLIVTLLFLMCLQKLISFLALKFPKLRTLFDGSPIIIVYKGKINSRNMKKSLYSIDDLITQMRAFEVDSIENIELAILETSGNLSVFKKEDFKEVALPVIISGKIIEDYLPYLNIKKEDVYLLLNKHQKKLEQTLYASYKNNDLSILEEFS